jgi:hypothetical protein
VWRIVVVVNGIILLVDDNPDDVFMVQRAFQKAEVGDTNRAYDGHVNSYLTKPVACEDLTAVVAALGDYWLTLNRIPEIRPCA